MLWFQPMPWLRWASIALLMLLAAWVELRPTSTEGVPFAIELIHPGQAIDSTNVEFVEVETDLMAPASLGEVAARTLMPGEPVLSSHVNDAFTVVPLGWWVIPMALPVGARVGDPVRLVLVDTGNEIEGVVAHPGSDDPFASADGGVAVPPEMATEAAVASTDGRIAVLLSSG